MALVRHSLLRSPCSPTQSPSCAIPHRAHMAQAGLMDTGDMRGSHGFTHLLLPFLPHLLESSCNPSLFLECFVYFLEPNHQPQTRTEGLLPGHSPCREGRCGGVSLLLADTSVQIVPTTSNPAPVGLSLLVTILAPICDHHTLFPLSLRLLESPWLVLLLPFPTSLSANESAGPAFPGSGGCRPCSPTPLPNL